MNFIATKFIGIFVIIFAMLTAGCPSPKTLAQAKASSDEVAEYANAGINITRDLYQQNLLGKTPAENLANKDKIALGFKALVAGGLAFDQAVANVEAQYGTNPVPKAQLDALAAVFNAELVSKLVTLLKTIGLTAVTSNFVKIIDTLKNAVTTIAKVFGKQTTATTTATLKAA